jgi:SAM-dependent methyltransferase
VSYELQKYGRVFYTTSPVAPAMVEHDGRRLYRYMDRIYIPDPPSKLDSETINDLSELRVLLRDEIIENQYTQAVLAYLYRMSIGNAQKVRVLDVGCGDGNIAALVLSQPLTARPLEVVGIDICHRVVGVAKERLESTHLGTALLINRDQKIPLKSNYFHSAVANFVFHFPASQREAIEIFRILVPGGRFVYNDYRFASDTHHFDSVAEIFRSVGFSVDVHENEFSQHFEDRFRIRKHKIITCTKPCF